MKNLLTIESLDATALRDLVELGAELKAARTTHAKPLKGETWALIFSKSSTRTRVSFEVGIRELGGYVMFLSSREMQLGRGELIKDTARVMGRIVHGAVIRTHEHADVVDFASYSGIPTINALTDGEHPCQILADLLTIKEKLGTWDGKKVCFIGDGDCNVSRSLMWAAARLGFELSVASPEDYLPGEALMERLNAPGISLTTNPEEAVKGADAVYTDVWVSMGHEEEATDRFRMFDGYQIDEAMMAHANPEAILLHCLPAYRGKEVSEETLEKHADTIFQQSENRLHAQKAVLVRIAETR